MERESRKTRDYRISELRVGDNIVVEVDMPRPSGVPVRSARARRRSGSSTPRHFQPTRRWEGDRRLLEARSARPFLRCTAGLQGGLQPRGQSSSTSGLRRTILADPACTPLAKASINETFRQSTVIVRRCPWSGASHARGFVRGRERRDRGQCLTRGAALTDWFAADLGRSMLPPPPTASVRRGMTT